MEVLAQVAVSLLMLVVSIPLHEGGHYITAKRFGYQSRVGLVLEKKASGFVTTSTRPYKIRDARDLERAMRESLGITGGGVLGLASPLTFLILAPEVWFVFVTYILILLVYAAYEITLTVKSWRYERADELTVLWM
ncbi:MAG: hypothetical protein NTV61_10450 [Candidatus Bathyarchaeota archaeon]|nr:hypothetical protein [Candidatus Bathyarchaeota archaeon]